MHGYETNLGAGQEDRESREGREMEVIGGPMAMPPEGWPKRRGKGGREISAGVRAMLPPDGEEVLAGWDEMAVGEPELGKFEARMAKLREKQMAKRAESRAANARAMGLAQKGRKRRVRSLLPGLGSKMEQHPDRAKIDAALMHRTMTVSQMVEAFPGVTAAQLTRRRADLKRRLYKGEETAREVERVRAQRAQRKTIDLLEHPLKEAMELGAKARELVEIAAAGKDLEAANALLGTAGGFIGQYMKSVEVYGRLVGDLAPPGAIQVNQDNRMLSILSLPRVGDPEE